MLTKWKQKSGVLMKLCVRIGNGSWPGVGLWFWSQLQCSFLLSVHQSVSGEGQSGFRFGLVVVSVVGVVEVVERRRLQLRLFMQRWQ